MALRAMATALLSPPPPPVLAPSPPNSPLPKSTQQPQAQLSSKPRRRFSSRAQAALDLDKARSNLPNDPNVDILRTDVTEGPEKLALAISDAEAVVCATGYHGMCLPHGRILYEGSISRDQVAEVAVEALFSPESCKVVEIVSRAEAPKCLMQDLFSAIKQSYHSSNL